MAVYVTQELTNSLEEIIFSRHKSYECDELQIISGYIGVDPVKKLSELPIRSKLVFGMYAEKGIQTALHNQVLDIHSENVKIFYSNQQIKYSLKNLCIKYQLIFLLKHFFQFLNYPF